jgi:hypothetical protein
MASNACEVYLLNAEESSFIQSAAAAYVNHFGHQRHLFGKGFEGLHRPRCRFLQVHTHRTTAPSVYCHWRCGMP